MKLKRIYEGSKRISSIFILAYFSLTSHVLSLADNQIGDTIQFGGALQYDVYPNQDAVVIPLPAEVQTLPFRIHLATYNPPIDLDWSVSLSSSSGVTFHYNGASFNTTTHDFLTAFFPSGTKSISISSKGSAPPLRATRALIYRSPPAPLSTVDTNNALGAPNLPNYVEMATARQARHSNLALTQRLNIAANAMVRLEIEDVKNHIIYSCSGILVSKQIVMTNHHCITEPAGKELRIRGWLHKLSPNSERKTATFQSLTPLSLNFYKKDMPEYVDVALLATSKPINGVTPAKLSFTLPAHLKTLAILQYPKMKVSSPQLLLNDDDDCILDQLLWLPGRHPRQVLMHGCDTDGGSSGSPIWSRSFDGGIVALHFWGHKNSEGLKNRAELMPYVLKLLAFEDNSYVLSMIKFQKELP